MHALIILKFSLVLNFMNHKTQILEKVSKIQNIRLLFLLVTVPIIANFFLYDDEYSKYVFYFVKAIPDELYWLYTFGSVFSVYVFYRVWILFINLYIYEGGGKYLSGISKKIILIFYLFMTIVYMGMLGKIGQEVESTPLVMTLNFIQPAFVLIILLYCMSCERGLLWWISLLSYIVFAAVSGFMTYYIYLLPLVLTLNGARLGILKTFIIISAFIFLSGFLRYWKYFLINPDAALQIDYINFKSLYWEWTVLNLSRMDFSFALYDVAENRNHLEYIFSSKNIMPYNSGFVLSFISKVVGFPTENLNQLWNEMIFGDQGSHYFPVIAYFLLPPAIYVPTLIFTVLMIFFGWRLILFVQRYLNDKDERASLFYGLMLVFILPQGWYWTFLNFLQGLSILAFLLIFLSIKPPRLLSKPNLEFAVFKGKD